MDSTLPPPPARFQNLVESSPDLIWEIDPEGRLIYVNAASLALLGCSPQSLVGQNLFATMAENSPAVGETVGALLQEGRTFRGLKTLFRRDDGSSVQLESCGAPVFDSDKRMVSAVVISRDSSIKDKMDGFLREVVRSSSGELSQANHSLRRAQRLARLGNWTWQGPGRPFNWQEGAADLLEPRDWEGLDSFEKLLEHVDYDGRPGLTQAAVDCLSDGKPLDHRFQLLFDGHEAVALRALAERIETMDGVPKVVGTFQDVTAEDALQNQLRQAQKMDAVGRLAGGIAHDFNNLLCGMIGFAEFAEMELALDHVALPDVQEVIAIAHRAAKLTSQLLLFSSRSPAILVDVDVNVVVEDLSRMLGRLIGTSIIYTTEPVEGIWNVQVDRSSLEQVLVNLVVNARDSMPGGGSITVRTRNERIARRLTTHFQTLAGDYTVVEVIDDGSGIPAAVLSRIFEPFFTTKGVGQGTGLGLSVCYGIVEQAGGAIDVTTAPGAGTKFSVYLPRSEDLVVAADPSESLPDTLPMGRGETILVVDSEILVLKILERTLSALGYQVLTFANPEEILGQLQDLRGAALLVAEYSLPGMNGSELSRQISAVHPAIRTLLMCADLPQDLALSGSSILVKPFGRDRLAVAVRRRLDIPTSA